MKNISYQESNNSLSIADNLKQQYWILSGVMFINLFNGALNLMNWTADDPGFINYLWIVLMFVSIGVLCWFLFGLSTQKEIPLDQIKCLKTHSIFGSTRLSFHLKNGKRRHLTHLKSTPEATELKVFLQELGIVNC